MWILVVVACVWANPCTKQDALTMTFNTEQECRVAAGYVDRKSDDQTKFFAVCTQKVRP